MEPNKTNESISGAEGPSSKLMALLAVIFAIVLFYVGGWYVAWGTTIYGSTRSIFLDFDRGTAFLVNGSYYGMLFESRFFNSSFISVICFFAGWSVIGAAINMISPNIDEAE